MKIRKYSWLMCVLLVVLSNSITLQQVHARAITLGKFYLISMDNQTQDNSIWEGDGSTLNVRRIWTVQRFDATLTPNQVFSQHELSVLSSTNTFNLKVNTAGISRFIHEIWLLDSTRLLVLTNTMACDQPLDGCFGFYEFLILNVQTGSVSSLLKIDLHDAMFLNCGYLDLLWFGEIEINPSPLIDKFAFTLWPKEYCDEVKSSSLTRIVDYSSSPVTITTMPKSNGLAWSPDGHHLAYYTRDDCSRKFCTVSIKVMTLSSKAVPQILYQVSQYGQHPIFVGWLDNRTLIHQVDDGSESLTLTFWQDIVDNSRGSFPIPTLFTLGSLYRLSNGVQSNIVTAKYPWSDSIGFSAQRLPPTIVDLPHIQGLYYNPRYNGYAATNIEGTTIHIIDSELVQSTINLTSFASLAPNEIITWFESGDIVKTSSIPFAAVTAGN